MSDIIYTPEVFDRASIEDAKQIILTAEDSSTQERWEKESPYIAQRVINFMKIGKDDLIIDFGCGIGRISKELIQRTGCKVIGVDISKSMRSQAVEYVNDERFTAISPDLLEQMLKKGLRVNGIVCIWVLQHIPKPQKQISMLHNLLQKDGKLFLLNNLRSALPTNVGWVDEGSDIKALMKESFIESFMDVLPAMISSKKISENSFMAGYCLKENI